MNIMDKINAVERETMRAWTLPADIARCDGRPADGPTPAWKGLFIHEECRECRRRTDRPDHPRLSWMAPPAETPCRERL